MPTLIFTLHLLNEENKVFARCKNFHPVKHTSSIFTKGKIM